MMRQMVQPAIEPVPVALDEHSKSLTVPLLGAEDQDMLLVDGVGEFFKESQADGPFQGLNQASKNYETSVHCKLAGSAMPAKA